MQIVSEKIASKNISGEIMSKKVTCISLTDGKTPYANGYTASFYHIQNKKKYIISHSTIEQSMAIYGSNSCEMI